MFTKFNSLLSETDEFLEYSVKDLDEILESSNIDLTRFQSFLLKICMRFLQDLRISSTRCELDFRIFYKIFSKRDFMTFESFLREISTSFENFLREVWTRSQHFI